MVPASGSDWPMRLRSASASAGVSPATSTRRGPRRLPSRMAAAAQRPRTMSHPSRHSAVRIASGSRRAASSWCAPSSSVSRSRSMGPRRTAGAGSVTAASSPLASAPHGSVAVSWNHHGHLPGPAGAVECRTRIPIAGQFQRVMPGASRFKCRRRTCRSIAASASRGPAAPAPGASRGPRSASVRPSHGCAAAPAPRFPTPRHRHPGMR